MRIVYQDQDIAVINKPQGLTVHAGNGTNGATLVNALLYHLDNLSGINGVLRPGIVHRIDKNTSGLLVVAKNDKAHLMLAKQLEDKTCSRVYVALLEGVLKQDNGTIATFIGRNPKDRTKMAVVENGRDAVTNFSLRLFSLPYPFTYCFLIFFSPFEAIFPFCDVSMHQAFQSLCRYSICGVFLCNSYPVWHSS